MALSSLTEGAWLLLAKIHGHVALLGLALLLHPVVGLRRARRVTAGAWLSAWLATVGLVVMNALGWLIYPAYREQVRATLYRAARGFGLAFEVKEHLAWYALCLGLAGLGLAWAARRAPAGPDATLGPAFWVGAVRRLYLAAFLLALTSAVLGVLLATLHTFPTALTPR